MDQGAAEPVGRGVSAHAVAGPDRPALVVADRVRTYAELDDRARRLAAVLSAMGAGPGRPVASVLRNGFEPFEVATAAAMAGAPYLPVNWHLKATELAYLLGDAGVGAVVGHADLAPVLDEAMRRAGLGGQPLRVDVPGADEVVAEGGYEACISAAVADPSLDSGAGPELVFYTSGTTARPKGVVHGGLGDLAARRAGMEGQALLWGWTPDDVYLMSGPAYHAAHAGWALTALYVGATTVVLDRFDAREFLVAVERHHATRSFMVPAHFIRLLEVPEDERRRIDVSTLRLVVHGGAPCPVPVKQRMMEAFSDTEIHELYGASEGGATRISPAEWREHPGSVGRPWPGVEIRVLADDGTPVPAGTDGIIWIRPPGTQRFTYRNDPDATSQAWRDDAFSVGDIGHLDADGYLTITDRVSDMVLWGGVNIAPREIEEVLYLHPAVVDCAVLGVPHDRDGEQLKAIVEVRSPVAVEELADHVRRHLADYKVPRVWEIVDELPRDPNGKVVKRLLRPPPGS
ncbi:MAG: AMP-binding protein [Acidimicrobiales bacterium]